MPEEIDYILICLVFVDERFWLSGSMWGTNKYFWCPLGVRLFPNSVHYTPEGSAAVDSYLLSIVFKNNSGTMSYTFVDENPSRYARALCEEY